jgi:hypothetical protein
MTNMTTSVDLRELGIFYIGQITIKKFGTIFL